MASQHPIKKSEQERVTSLRPLGMMEEMERMMENYFPRGWLKPFHLGPSTLAESMPQMDVLDREDEVLVRAAVPGIKKDDLEVSLTDHTVTIRGSSRSEEKHEEKGEYYCNEISQGSFLRTVTLPASVDDAKARASFKDGILEITIPKMESSKRHSIKIE